MASAIPKHLGEFVGRWEGRLRPKSLSEAIEEQAKDKEWLGSLV